MRVRRYRDVQVLLLIFLVVGCSAAAESYEVEIAGEVFRVEVADDPESRARGLMHREEMDGDRGMLFVFERSELRAFWMRNTLIPLSIAYIDENLRILEIHDMIPLSETPVPSRFPAQFALELNQGEFERRGIAVGDRLVPSNELRERISSTVGR